MTNTTGPNSTPTQDQACGAVHGEILVQTTQSWNGIAYGPYPNGQPQLTVLKMTIPPRTALPWHTHAIPNAAFILSGRLTIEDKAAEHPSWVPGLRLRRRARSRRRPPGRALAPVPPPKSVDEALIEVGLSHVPLPVLMQVLDAIEDERLDCPVSDSALMATGFGVLAGGIASTLRGLGRDAATRALRLVIAERVHRPPPRLSLVWTGPESRGSLSRDTALVVRDLFAGAKRSVIVGGYSFERAEILEPLHVAMLERHVTASVFLHIGGEPTSSEGAEGIATAAIDRFFRDVWTFGAPKPEVFYDPRTAMKGPPWASLHAKCVVVDDEKALITSANFTDRGQTRNIEAGVLIEDRAFAAELAAQWRQLVVAGIVRRYVG